MSRKLFYVFTILTFLQFIITLNSQSQTSVCVCCEDMLPVGAVLANSTNTPEIKDWTIQEMQDRLKTNTPFTRHLRIRCKTEGVVTYVVPVEDSEVCG